MRRRSSPGSPRAASRPASRPPATGRRARVALSTSRTPTATASSSRGRGRRHEARYTAPAVGGRGRAPMSLSGKTLFITGASRGIGLAIALRAARDGANIAIAAKTEKLHPKLAGTIYTAAEEIEHAGGTALPLVVDVRDEAMVKDALAQTASRFGGIDIVVNNASAIALTPVAATDMKRFDLMQQINARGTFVVSRWAIGYLEKAANPHILMISPPLDMKEKWFAPHTAYSMAKFGMSLVVLGLAGELREKGIAVNALWPRTVIATAAVQNLLGGE